jgi:hypothetical protein
MLEETGLPTGNEILQEKGSSKLCFGVVNSLDPIWNQSSTHFIMGSFMLTN